MDSRLKKVEVMPMEIDEDGLYDEDGLMKNIDVVVSLGFEVTLDSGGQRAEVMELFFLLNAGTEDVTLEVTAKQVKMEFNKEEAAD